MPSMHQKNMYKAKKKRSVVLGAEYGVVSEAGILFF